MLRLVPLFDSVPDSAPVPASRIRIVHVGAELIVCWCFGGNTTGGDIEAGYPDQPIEDYFAEIIVRPVDMAMTAGEAEAAAATRPFKRPGNVLRHTHPCANVRIAAMRAIRSFTCAVRRNSSEYRCDILHILPEAHVVVPFVTERKGLYTSCDRVLGDISEIRLP